VAGAQLIVSEQGSKTPQIRFRCECGRGKWLTDVTKAVCFKACSKEGVRDMWVAVNKSAAETKAAKAAKEAAVAAAAAAAGGR
jgi:hypothetical protein